MTVTLMLVTAAVIAFRLAVLHLKILPRAVDTPKPPVQLPRITRTVFPAQPSAAVN